MCHVWYVSIHFTHQLTSPAARCNSNAISTYKRTLQSFTRTNFWLAGVISSLCDWVTVMMKYAATGAHRFLFWLADSSTAKCAATVLLNSTASDSSKTSAHVYQTTRRHIKNTIIFKCAVVSNKPSVLQSSGLNTATLFNPLANKCNFRRIRRIEKSDC